MHTRYINDFPSTSFNWFSEKSDQQARGLLTRKYWELVNAVLTDATKKKMQFVVSIKKKNLAIKIFAEKKIYKQDLTINANKHASLNHETMPHYTSELT